MERDSKEGTGTSSKGCLWWPWPPGAGPAPLEPSLCGDTPGPQPGRPGSWGQLQAGEGRVPAHPGPCKGVPAPAVTAQKDQVRRNPPRSAEWWGRLCAATEPSCVVCWVADQPEEKPVPLTTTSKVKKKLKNGRLRFVFPCLEVFSLWVFLEGKNGRSEMIPCQWEKGIYSVQLLKSHTPGGRIYSGAVPMC